MRLSGIRSRQPQRRISGRLWPCREFSYGVVPSRPDERLDDRPVEISLPGDDGTPAGLGRTDEEKAAAPLDLSNLPNSHNEGTECLLSAGETGLKTAKRPKTYGRRGITGYGKKMIKSVGALIDRYYPHHRVTFCTVTMPPLSGEKRYHLAEVWPRLVNRLMQWLRRHLSRKQLPPLIASVSEVQPKRLSDTGEGYLHLHMLWLNSPGKRGRWAIDVLNLRAWILDFLIREGVCSEQDHINADVRPVRGEAAGYLAKYCSKGGDVIAEFAEDLGWHACPGQWWNVSKAARDWVKEHLLSGFEIGGFLEHRVWQAWDTNDFEDFRYLYQVEAALDGILVNVGWRGCLWPAAYDDYLDAISKNPDF